MQFCILKLIWCQFTLISVLLWKHGIVNKSKYPCLNPSQLLPWWKSFWCQSPAVICFRFLSNHCNIVGNICKFLICTLSFFHCLFWNDLPARLFIFNFTKKFWTTPPMSQILYIFNWHASSYVICRINFFCWNYLYWEGSEHVWMSQTLFATKDLNNRLWLWIQYKRSYYQSKR